MISYFYVWCVCVCVMCVLVLCATYLQYSFDDCRFDKLLSWRWTATSRTTTTSSIALITRINSILVCFIRATLIASNEYIVSTRMYVFLFNSPRTQLTKSHLNAVLKRKRGNIAYRSIQLRSVLHSCIHRNNIQNRFLANEQIYLYLLRLWIEWEKLEREREREISSGTRVSLTKKKAKQTVNIEGRYLLNKLCL